MVYPGPLLYHVLLFLFRPQGMLWLFLIFFLPVTCFIWQASQIRQLHVVTRAVLIAHKPFTVVFLNVGNANLVKTCTGSFFFTFIAPFVAILITNKGKYFFICNWARIILFTSGELFSDGKDFHFIVIQQKGNLSFTELVLYRINSFKMSETKAVWLWKWWFFVKMAIPLNESI